MQAGLGGGVVNSGSHFLLGKPGKFITIGFSMIQEETENIYFEAGE